MHEVTLKNFRCFREEQKVRLAPLTFLVGENSTGKTSFLALVRALQEIAFESKVPDFREPPYDLGTFEEIAYNRARGGAKSFEAGFSTQLTQLNVNTPTSSSTPSDKSVTFSVTFESRNGVPYPTTRRLSDGKGLVEINPDGIRLAVPGREARVANPQWHWSDDDEQLIPLRYLTRQELLPDILERLPGQTDDDSSYQSLTKEDLDYIESFASHIWFEPQHAQGLYATFAGAPVRSTPRRTYDPTRPFRDPGGEYIPTLLANLSRRNPEEWEHLKGLLELFGRSAGLFDEIDIESLGKTDGSPFQVMVRKYSGKAKGKKRNLIDVGYGVSQVLPVLTELLRIGSTSLFLLQQPEVHLHPTAQAALGSLFCLIASFGLRRQIIVETHSDYILDRVRMDIRDKKTHLKPEDVSILYFEPLGQEVKIHSISLDKSGNLVDPPRGYRQFFMDEVNRFIRP